VSFHWIIADRARPIRIQEGIAASGVEMQGPPDIKEFEVHEIIHA
jgi:hypothetical protein